MFVRNTSSGYTVAALNSSNTTKPPYLAIACVAATDTIPASYPPFAPRAHSPGKLISGKPNGRNVFFSAIRRVNVFIASDERMSRALGSSTISSTPAALIFSVSSARSLSESARIAIGASCSLANSAKPSQSSGPAPYISGRTPSAACRPFAITSGSLAIRISGSSAVSSTPPTAAANLSPSPVASTANPSIVRSTPTYSTE